MSERVLVAQASHTLQLLIRMTLSAERLDVTCMADGRDALADAQRLAPRLVIADSELPGLDGYSLAEQLGQDPSTAEVPVLLLVADWDGPDADRVAHAGIADVLPKPFEQHDLLERVRALLGQETPQEASEAHVAQSAAVTSAPPLSPLPSLTGPSPAELQELVARELQALVLPRVEAMIEGAVKDAVTALFTDPSKELGDKVGAALQAAAEEETRRTLDSRAAELLGPTLKPLLEPIVWKVVPELAEDMLREEIRRLTEEENP